jgi:hypothetical protein
MTFSPATTLATNCKSSGGGKSEGSSFRTTSILNRSIMTSETPNGNAITVKRYTRTSNQLAAQTEACNGTHVVIYIATIKRGLLATKTLDGTERQARREK